MQTINLFQWRRFQWRLLGQLGLAVLAAAGLVVIGVAGTLLVMSGITHIKGVRRDVPAAVTSHSIRQVKLGMTAGQVVQCIGPPYRVGGWAPMHTAGCQNPLPDWAEQPPTDLATTLRQLYTDTLRYCCQDYREQRRHAAVNLLYSRPVDGAGEYPTVGVRLDADGRVESVWVTHYSWLGDVLNDTNLPAYSLRRDLDGRPELFQHPDDLRRLLGR